MAPTETKKPAFLSLSHIYRSYLAVNPKKQLF